MMHQISRSRDVISELLFHAFDIVLGKHCAVVISFDRKCGVFTWLPREKTLMNFSYYLLHLNSDAENDPSSCKFCIFNVLFRNLAKR